MGVWYSVFVRSFADSNNDGVGDLKGLISKLDYFSTLGIEGLWLLPVFVSPSYHKYDIVNYKNIDPEYGSLKDFDKLISEAHKRGIKIILDLVLNHTSSSHHYFIAANRSKKNPYRNFYVWKKKEDVQTEPHWYPAKNESSDEFYYAFFWEEMPDLNYDFIPVREAVKDITAFWLKRGVDGFRMDAAMHIYPPGREQDNYLWWQEFRMFVDSIKPDAVIVGEITSSCDYIAPYLANGLKSAFNFEIAERIINAVADGNENGFIKRFLEIRSLYKQTDARAVDSLFLSNHDQNRIASVLKGDQKRLKLAASILLTLPGIPFLYYGEEIGMFGQKPDEHIREPFLFSDIKNDINRTKWISADFSNDKTVVPLSVQQKDPSSLFSHYANLISIRNKYAVLDKGEIFSVDCADPSILIFTRNLNEEIFLVFHNLDQMDVILKNEDHTPHQFEMIYVSEEGCDANDFQFRICAFSTMVLKVIPLS